VPRVDRVNFSLSVGTVVPTTVRVIEVAPALIEIYPEWRGHFFFVVRDDIVVVDRSHKIVAVVPLGPSSAEAPSGPQGGGGAAVALNLSPEEIRQVQIVLKEKGVYDGPIDGVFGPRMRTALITFQRSQGLQVTGQIDVRTVTALNVNVRQGTQPSATGQSGAPQQPANQQGTQQQPPANQQQQGAQGGQQPSTSGQAGQPPTNQQGTQGGAQPPTSGSGSDRMQQQAPQSGAPGQSGGQAK